MPYLIRERDGEFCVFTEGPDKQPQGSPHGCHPTRDQAVAQQRALYANAPKGFSESETKRVATPVELKADGDAGSLRATFSVFDVLDHDGDVVRKQAFAAADGREIPLCWSHDWARPVGKGTIRVLRDRAVFDGKFFLQTDDGRNAYETAKAMGGLQEFSWGFRVPPDGQKTIQWEGQDAREITKADIYEVSCVLKGAGIGTRIESIKAADPVLDAVAERLEPELKVGRRISRQTESHIRAALDALSALLEAETEAADAESDDEGKSADESLVAAGERLADELAGYVARVSATANEDLRKDRDALAGFSRRLSARQAEVDRALALAIKAEDAGPQELRRQYRETVARLGLPVKET